MQIHLYTLCYNEMDILPYVLEYWKQLPITKAVVYDNGSTDGSIEYLQQYPWIEVRHFETEGQNDVIQAVIKNNAWKESIGKADFVICCDMDEMLYSDDIESELKYMKEHDYNVMGTFWFALCEDFKPEHKDGVLLHTQCHKFYRQHINHTKEWKHLGKFMLFDPNKVTDMRYSVGCHISYPLPQLKLYETDKTFAIHINKGFGEDYFADRRKKMGDNLSSVNKANGMCYEYNLPRQKTIAEYRYYQEHSFDINVIEAS